MISALDVAVYTWNAAETLEQGVPLPTSGWLTAVGASDNRPATAPDICAVGLQESISLPQALAGATPSFIDTYEHLIKKELDANAKKATSDTSYTLLARHSIGAIALLIYIKQDLRGLVEDVAKAEAGCGPLFMSNKGAVGLRFRLKESGIALTFITAHLAPHDYNVARRNMDWQALVERLVFYQHVGGERYQLYDTDYLFVFGDLNYRTSKTEPRSLNKADMQSFLDKGEYNKILAHDQLGMEVSAKRTLHHLTEKSITFPPTYKYSKGSNGLVSFDKRAPSYCDRILHLPSEGQEVLVYKSLHGPNPSDHKPVVAHYRIQPSKQERTRWPSPYSVDESALWNAAAGTVLDRIIGNIWRSIALAGFGNDKLGLFIVLFGLASALLYRQWNFSLSDTFDKFEYVYKRLQ